MRHDDRAQSSEFLEPRQQAKLQAVSSLSRQTGESAMNRNGLLTLGMLWLMAGMGAPCSAEESTLLAKPQLARINVASSPKFDDRVFVYLAQPLSVPVLEHNVAGKELLLGAGAKEGIRFGHAFNIFAPNSELGVGIAKVMELEERRCIAKVVSFSQEGGSQSAKGFIAVCTAPKSNAKTTTIKCDFGKDIWQTESFENQLIRGLLESGGDQIRILVRQEQPSQKVRGSDSKRAQVPDLRLTDLDTDGNAVLFTISQKSGAKNDSLLQIVFECDKGFTSLQGNVKQGAVIIFPQAKTRWPRTEHPVLRLPLTQNGQRVALVFPDASAAEAAKKQLRMDGSLSLLAAQGKSDALKDVPHGLVHGEEAQLGKYRVLFHLMKEPQLGDKLHDGAPSPASDERKSEDSVGQAAPGIDASDLAGLPMALPE